MVREPDATMQPAPQDIQLMSKHRVLSLKPHLRLEWRGQDGQNETEQPDHPASLGDSITSSTRIRFSVHEGGRAFSGMQRDWQERRSGRREGGPHERSACRPHPMLHHRGGIVPAKWVE